MSSYFQFYKDRIFLNGKTSKARVENDLARDFQYLLKNSPNKVQINYKGNTYDCILTSNSRNNSQSEKKVLKNLKTELSLKLNDGDSFSTIESKSNTKKYWLVLHRETYSYYGYYKYKIIELNRIIKCIINGKIEEFPVYLTGSREETLKEFFKIANLNVVELPNEYLNLIMPTNLKLDSKTRFIIGDEAWVYVESDKISIPGVSYVTLKRTTIDYSSDNLTEGIADYNKYNLMHFISNFGKEEIQIGLNCKPLEFFLVQDGRIIEANISIKFNEDFFELRNNSLIPKKEGKTSLIIQDLKSNYNENLEITIIPELLDYLFIVGDSKIRINSSKTLSINTDNDYSIDYEKDFIAIEKFDDSIIIKSLNKIGNTKLSFKFKEKEVIFDLNITSLWV